MRLRKASRRDLFSILKIEKTIYEKPYFNEKSLKHLFSNSITDTALVFELNKRIIGFLIEQRCLNEISILNVAVENSFQNNGFGKKILNQYLSEIPDNSVVFLEVNINNFIAQKIYYDLNFHKIDVRKSYYNDGGDALIMKYEKKSN